MDFLNAMGGTATGFFGALIPFLIVLTVVVFVHEMGHFLVGRWCGVGVNAFSIGFGPEIVGFNDRHGTRWKLCAIPLGGYVKFKGDANGASVPDPEAVARMSPQERATSFPTQPVSKRAAIVVAGPLANFILAVALFGGAIWVGGRYELPARIEAVLPDSAASRAGFEAGDVVTAIDGSPVRNFIDMQRTIASSADSTLTITVDRAGAERQLTATPEVYEEKTPFGRHRVGRLGLQGPKGSDAKLVRYGPVDSFVLGVRETYFVVERTFNYLGKLITGRESPDQLSGPIGIAKVSGEVARIGGVGGLVGLVALLSVSIGLLNLFPVPLLDGGHLMFYAFEAVRGKPLSERTQEIGFRVGLALVLMLMLFATWNDTIGSYLRSGT
ncbi:MULTISPECIES: RIP metalloprotease RseP [Methylobacterium]|uniref:Zinc metalloprotease n=3 Tax=Pseudomonadota TaxID=1224 RepID=A0ABQ4SRV5_9HYPH|nr:MULTISPECIES: RIP metalloprotease RseP [Methylobacterium]PIU07569.1 MAG: RIP metalloprotease RseP [Methylobacterium sp. CG09_land_8_20_14_0_10_71_15]PIU16301.1 MAG: RIP metalloprotease RseP [Methylobacterium sp. CG08_land_8_20_14_0_20_71_15]GBU18276.1 zinc metalloprotease [Methylobacterium sp.]GJE05921.1 Metalloprotease MmpA [Methylobacterium jeotgali]